MNGPPPLHLGRMSQARYAPGLALPRSIRKGESVRSTRQGAAKDAAEVSCVCLAEGEGNEGVKSVAGRDPKLCDAPA